jgi:hypothetical protein
MFPRAPTAQRLAVLSSRTRSPAWVAFLAGPEARAITGVSLPVDYGWLLAPPWHTYGGLRQKRG